MMSQPSRIRWPGLTAILGSDGVAHRGEGRWLTVDRWLPLVLVPVLAASVALSIVSGRLYLLVPLILLVPGVVLLSRHPLAAIVIWILLFPFFVRTPGRAERYVYYVLHRAMIPVTLAHVVLSYGLGVRRRKAPVELGGAEITMLAFLVLAVANILVYSSDADGSLVHLYDRTLVPFCAYWLLRLTAPRQDALQRLVWVALFLVITQAAVGLLGWYWPQVLPPQWLNRLGERTTGTLGNPAVYSTTLILFSLLLFQLAMHCKSGRLRAVLLSVFSVGLFCVFFTFSRGSWLAGAAVLLGLLLVYPREVLSVMVPVATMVLILGGSLLSNEMAWARDRLAAADTAEDRVVLLNTGLSMVKAKPLFGWGYDNYDLYDDQFKTRVWGIPARTESGSHNTYLTILAELGLGGTLIYLFPFWYWLRRTVRVARKLPEEGFWSWRLLVMLWLSIGGHVIAASFMDMRFHEFGLTLWWMTLGFVASMVSPYVTRRQSLQTLRSALGDE